MVALPFFLTVAVLVSAASAATDVKTERIPNGLTLGPLVLAPLLHFALTARAFGASAGLGAAGMSVAGALVCSIAPALLYRANAIGGGDVKLFAALGALLQPMMGIEAELYGFVAAALFAPARMAWEGKLLRVLGNTFALVANPILPRDRRRAIHPEMMTWMRLGPFIFVGVAVEALAHVRGAP
ncbi:MAG: A24 family peptidase [Polyangiaceae bacterium]